MEKNVARFLFSGPMGEGTIENAQFLTKSIVAVNHSFLQTKMLTRAMIVNGHSDADSIKEKVRASNLIPGVVVLRDSDI